MVVPPPPSGPGTSSISGPVLHEEACLGFFAHNFCAVYNKRPHNSQTAPAPVRPQPGPSTGTVPIPDSGPCPGLSVDAVPRSMSLCHTRTFTLALTFTHTLLRMLPNDFHMF